MYKKIARGVYNPPDHLSRDAKSFLNRILIVEPSRRANAHQLLEDPWLKNINISNSHHQTSDMFLSTNESSQLGYANEAWRNFERKLLE